MDLLFDLFWPAVWFLLSCLVVLAIVLPDIGRLMLSLTIGLPLILIYRVFTGDRAMPPKDRIIALVLCLCLASPVMANPFHRAMVARSGIQPNRVGSYEGVGMSTRSYEAARNNACYWGQRVPVSIQYSKQGNRYYAVVRYR